MAPPCVGHEQLNQVLSYGFWLGLASLLRLYGSQIEKSSMGELSSLVKKRIWAWRHVSSPRESLMPEAGTPVCPRHVHFAIRPSNR
jgi:hypothetical protein